jgi:nucleoside-diphosphate-sugar epimerase
MISRIAFFPSAICVQRVFHRIESIYGKAGDRVLGEKDALNPVSVYTGSKIEAERAIAPLADADFSPAYLRNATAYGHSPMLRIDLVVNNLLAGAVAKGDIHIMSDGTPWQPLSHCKDIARAFIAFLEAPQADIHNQSVNIGGDTENYQVRDIADIVERLVPGARIVTLEAAWRNRSQNIDNTVSRRPI